MNALWITLISVFGGMLYIFLATVATIHITRFLVKKCRKCRGNRYCGAGHGCPGFFLGLIWFLWAPIWLGIRVGKHAELKETQLQEQYENELAEAKRRRQIELIKDEEDRILSRRLERQRLEQRM